MTGKLCYASNALGEVISCSVCEVDFKLTYTLFELGKHHPVASTSYDSNFSEYRRRPNISDFGISNPINTLPRQIATTVGIPLPGPTAFKIHHKTTWQCSQTTQNLTVGLPLIRKHSLVPTNPKLSSSPKNMPLAPTGDPTHTQPNLKPSDVYTRPATHHDLHFLPAIFNHYISQTVISFRLELVDVGLYEGVWEDTRKYGLPFFVSCTCGVSEHKDAGTELEEVIGYVYALPFRPYYPAYGHTVEISIFIHPEYHSLRVGSALMDVLMDALRTTQVFNPALFPTNNDVAEEDKPGRIRQALAVMSLDPKGRDNGHGLEKFYARWKFKRVGHLKKVGYKFGMWIDVVFLQASL